MNTEQRANSPGSGLLRPPISLRYFTPRNLPVARPYHSFRHWTFYFATQSICVGNARTQINSGCELFSCFNLSSTDVAYRILMMQSRTFSMTCYPRRRPMRFVIPPPIGRKVSNLNVDCTLTLPLLQNSIFPFSR